MSFCIGRNLTALRPISPIAPHHLPPVTDERKKQQWKEASRRYAAKNREIINEKSRVRRKAVSADPEAREKLNFRRRAKGIGITKKQWEKMFDSQGHVCAICRGDNPGTPRGWHLDHCHKTKKIRFILCTHCNRGLGGFRDDPDLMRRAADALEEFNQRRLEDGEVE